MQSDGSRWTSGLVLLRIGDDGWEIVAESVSASAAGISESETGSGMVVRMSAGAGESTAALTDQGQVQKHGRLPVQDLVQLPRLVVEPRCAKSPLDRCVESPGYP